MSSTCGEFAEHVWKPGSCKNCFHPRSAHHRHNTTATGTTTVVVPVFSRMSVGDSEDGDGVTFASPCAKPTIAVRPTMMSAECVEVEANGGTNREQNFDSSGTRDRLEMKRVLELGPLYIGNNICTTALKDTICQSAVLGKADYSSNKLSPGTPTKDSTGALSNTGETRIDAIGPQTPMVNGFSPTRMSPINGVEHTTLTSIKSPQHQGPASPPLGSDLRQASLSDSCSLCSSPDSVTGPSEFHQNGLLESANVFAQNGPASAEPIYAESAKCKRRAQQGKRKEQQQRQQQLSELELKLEEEAKAVGENQRTTITVMAAHTENNNRTFYLSSPDSAVCTQWPHFSPPALHDTRSPTFKWPAPLALLTVETPHNTSGPLQPKLQRSPPLPPKRNPCSPRLGTSSLSLTHLPDLNGGVSAAMSATVFKSHHSSSSPAGLFTNGNGMDRRQKLSCSTLTSSVGIEEEEEEEEEEEDMAELSREHPASKVATIITIATTTTTTTAAAAATATVCNEHNKDYSSSMRPGDERGAAADNGASQEQAAIRGGTQQQQGTSGGIGSPTGSMLAARTAASAASAAAAASASRIHHGQHDPAKGKVASRETTTTTTTTPPPPPPKKQHRPCPKMNRSSLELDQRSQRGSVDSLVQSPGGMSSLAQSPGGMSSLAHSPGGMSSLAHSPGGMSSLAQSPGGMSSLAQSPGGMSSLAHSPGGMSSLGHSPGRLGSLGHSTGGLGRSRINSSTDSLQPDTCGLDGPFSTTLVISVPSSPRADSTPPCMSPAPVPSQQPQPPPLPEKKLINRTLSAPGETRNRMASLGRPHLPLCGSEQNVSAIRPDVAPSSSSSSSAVDVTPPFHSSSDCLDRGPPPLNRSLGSPINKETRLGVAGRLNTHRRGSVTTASSPQLSSPGSSPGPAPAPSGSTLHLQTLLSNMDSRECIYSKLGGLYAESLRRLAIKCEEHFTRSQRSSLRFDESNWSLFKLTCNKPSCQAGDAIYYSASCATDASSPYAVKICRGTSTDLKQGDFYGLTVQQSLPGHFNVQQDCGHFIACVPQSMLPSEEPAPPASSPAPTTTTTTTTTTSSLSGKSEQEHVVVITNEVPYQTASDFVRDWSPFHKAQPEVYERRICFLLLQLCNGLEHLKANGVTHRDLCLENLLLVSHGQAAGGNTPDAQSQQLPRLVISNFTKAKQRAAEGPAAKTDPRLKRDHARLAPEIVSAAQYRKFDEFQVGILIYELLHQPNPFEVSPALREQEYRCQDLPPIPAVSLYSAGLQRLACLLLQSDPIKRIHIQDAKRVLQSLLWGPRRDMMEQYCTKGGGGGGGGGGSSSSSIRNMYESQGEGLLNWLDVKRALLMMKFAERSLEPERNAELEDWLCCQYFSTAHPLSLCHTAELLYSFKAPH